MVKIEALDKGHDIHDHYYNRPSTESRRVWLVCGLLPRLFCLL